jgi:hypothetical protein
MDWFAQLRQTLSRYYTTANALDIVGYLQGSASPAVWRTMAQNANRNQMIILGNAPPNREDWEAAGVAQRGEVQTIRIGDLGGWIVLYGGFIRRPWGSLFEIDADALNIGFPAALQSWQRNMPRR